jgi:hypothetical protein
VLAGCLLATLAAGCGAPAKLAAPVDSAESAARDRRFARPILVQQLRAYPETATGLFVCLADFEPGVSLQAAQRQAARFSVLAAEGANAPRGRTAFTVQLSRTGSGALRVDLPPGGRLRMACGEAPWDFREHTLLSVAVHSQRPRDDLAVTLIGPRRSWSVRPGLLEPGWNTVEVDLQNARGQVDLSSIRGLEISLIHAAESHRLHLDDVMLINNRRRIEPVPTGMKLDKTGGNYTLQLPGWPQPLWLNRGADGLWRFENPAAGVQVLAGPPQAQDDEETAAERLSAMGPNRIGRVRILESNRIRLRIENAWFFPERGGIWAAEDAVPQIRWLHTFYRDGRWVVEFHLRTAGALDVQAVRFAGQMPLRWFPEPQRSAGKDSWPVRGGSLRLRGLLEPPTPIGGDFTRQYLQPGRLAARLGTVAETPVPGGFDPSEGCYRIAAERGHCRFLFQPPASGAVNPVFRVGGPFDEMPVIHADGLALREKVLLEDGSVLFVLGGQVLQGRRVEVRAPAEPAAGPR